MVNGRCRLHGGRSTGPKTSDGKRRIKLANTKHGFYSAEAIAERRMVSKLLKASWFVRESKAH
ncbi:MAG: HGGxSTG domain-containing protein [Rhabdochlamydiaceae bacterium]